MKKFYLEIITPEKVFFRGQTEEITVSTVTGYVTIMAEHAPTVLALQAGSVRIKSDGQWKEAFLSDGFAEIRPDETIILSQAVEWPDEIDEKKALEAKERAEEVLRRKESIQVYKSSKAALQRAFARLAVKNNRTEK